MIDWRDADAAAQYAAQASRLKSQQELQEAQPLDEEALMKAPAGLYQIPNHKRDAIWSMREGAWIYADWKQLARVIPQESGLPGGVDLQIRPDGMFIIRQWVEETVIGKFQTLAAVRQYIEKTKEAVNV